MLGAIAGDIIGSPYEFSPLRKNRADFPLFSRKSQFTDDTVMTIAVADAFRRGYGSPDLRDILVDSLKDFGRRWPASGYGGRFGSWLVSATRAPYNSFGNGSAMRVSPAGWLAESLEEAEHLAKLSAEVTHNHPEGIKGAQAVAGAIFMGRRGKSREEIRDYVAGRHGYDLSRTLAEIKPECEFDETCQVSVPEAITAFLESDSYEDAVRKAVWLGADADTQAAIAGSIAEAFYGGVPAQIASEALARLDEDLRKSLDAWRQWLKARKSADTGSAG